MTPDEVSAFLATTRQAILMRTRVDGTATGAPVRFDGVAEIDRETDARPFAVDVLAPRYWDVTDPEIAETPELWRAAPAEAFVLIRLRPYRIASG